MIPLDRYQKWSTALDARATTYLNESEYQDYASIPEPKRLSQLRALLERPIANFTPVNEVFFRARWAEVLRAVHPDQGLVLLEIASGDADMIPQMMARDYPNSRYIAANTNRILTESLLAKTRAIPLNVTVIGEDAIAIDRHLAPGSVDVVAFQHGVNDVLQAILCDRYDVDTTDSDWMQTLPRMIAIVQQEMAQGTLEEHVRPAFLSLLEKMLGVLKDDGRIVMNHYMFQLDLDWGYPPALWEDLIPFVRQWTQSLPGGREVVVDGFDPHWWLFLAKR